MTDAVIVRDLVKRYGSLTAVDGISFSVGDGEVFGLLGPNGAGKTTTIEMIESLRKPDAGSITVKGIDAVNDARRLKEIIGVQLQSTALQDMIKVREALVLYASYYQTSVPAEELLAEVNLAEKAGDYIKTLSGGQKQRVALALALVNDPQVLFLDEPTTGLDPQARRSVWDWVRRYRERGKTILLTTHYMEEAETLCDRVGIIDHGRIIALGTPAGLIAEAGLEAAVEFTCPEERVDDLKTVLETSGKLVERGQGRYTVFTAQPSALLQELTREANTAGINLSGLTVKEASLEDLFLKLTGRNLRE
ncbi:ABC transporter related protein [Dehalogenimonas lykanthroporepellens BL-DC-9]|nr:ABC transporter related protein [Dehalogenimonas lykanthroporepellens BL-DC-9]